VIRFASLGSGSAGNALLVESGATTLMLDCGFGLRETVTRCSASAASLAISTASS
jgi:phosphoribosyl 1,2-cyclic phosphodiesterase